MPGSFVNDTLADRLTHSAIALFGSPRNLGLLLFVALFAGFAGPFGTYDAFSTSERFLFWAIVVAGTAIAGRVTGTTADYLVARWNWHSFARLSVTSGVTAFPVSAVVALALIVFGRWPQSGDLVMLYVQCFGVVGALSFLEQTFSPTRERERPATGPKLLDRLPEAKRGQLVRLVAQDHYVSVTTTAGETLLAMRFRDAVAEATFEPGLQVHRSHWVAIGAISGRCRVNGKAGLRLKDGKFVPIGRKFGPTIRELGI
ncbi:MAG: LytTR family DNA-binding domain-containing protein [Pseudomonadota bacterium]